MRQASDSTIVNISENVVISGNYAGLDGGGIWSLDYDYYWILPEGAYGNLNIEETVRFSDNIAGNGSYQPAPFYHCLIFLIFLNSLNATQVAFLSSIQVRGGSRNFK